MPSGVLKWFNPQKGFGMITPDGKTPQEKTADVFVHITALQAAGLQHLGEGDRVIYELTLERGKEAATNMKKAI